MKEATKQRFSTIRARLIGVFTFFAVIPLMGIPFYLYFGLMQKIGVIELSQLNQGQQQLEQTIKTSEIAQLRNTQDYAHWDDAVRAVKNLDEAWMKEQVFDYVTKHYGYEFVIVADLQGNVMWGHQVPETLTRSVANLSEFIDARKGAERIGYLHPGNGVVAVSAANIIPLASEGTDRAAEEAVGVLLYGRRLDSSFANSIGASIAREVAFFDTQTVFALSETRQDISLGMSFADVDLAALHDVLAGKVHISDMPEHLCLYRPILSGSGQVIGAIRISQSKATTNFVRREMVRNVVVLFCVSILLLILLGFLIELLIVMPVLSFTEAMRRYRAHGRWRVKKLATRNDEVGDLYRAFETLIAEVEQSQRELVARDRQLGATNKKLAQNAEELSRAKELLESKLEEISKLNTFMIGREVRMAELKEELKRYRK